ncbi:MAG: aldo/keto reductase [Lachnospiraceae bacterium]|jgi:predicted aldo/keto reductase-like oxidoreductase
MIYRDFQDLKLSALDMGAMRLPVIDGKDDQIDEPAAAAMVDYAMAHGINYYDTAWGYHGGNSEPVMGRALKKYPRSSFYLATKFPGYDVRNFGKTEEIFEKQLQRLQTDYFDFYLFHNVCETNIRQYLDDEKYGTWSYLIQQRRNGRIRHLGFSCHGNMPVLKAFLEKYGKDMEFCQLQINYFDWKFQHAKEKVDLLREYGIPVWVMEPLRGGRLCRLSDEQEAVLKALRPEETAAQWAFRFLQSIPDVTVTLSGMSDMEQLKQNIVTFDEDKPLDDREMAGLMQVTDSMLSAGAVPCTACRYCVSHCPKELDIPTIMELYNQYKSTGDKPDFIAPMQIAAMPKEKRPAACIACRSCEKVCPQEIKISEIMDTFARALGEKKEEA